MTTGATDKSLHSDIAVANSLAAKVVYYANVKSLMVNVNNYSAVVHHTQVLK